jgi:hypothetical protein
MAPPHGMMDSKTLFYLAIQCRDNLPKNAYFFDGITKN